MSGPERPVEWSGIEPARDRCPLAIVDRVGGEDERLAETIERGDEE